MLYRIWYIPSRMQCAVETDLPTFFSQPANQPTSQPANQQTQPTQPAQPTQPTQPAQPTQPTQPGSPTSQPSKPRHQAQQPSANPAYPREGECFFGRKSTKKGEAATSIYRALKPSCFIIFLTCRKFLFIYALNFSGGQ